MKKKDRLRLRALYAALERAEWWLDYNMGRRMWLLERRAPSWMLNRYTEEIEAGRRQIGDLKLEIADLEDMQYKGAFDR